MSTQNQISVTIDPETLASIIGKLAEAKTLLAPYLQGLTAEERSSLFKMGDKTVATVLKTKSYMTTNPEFIPNYMDDAEFMKDANLVDQLTPIANIAQQLSRDLEDTIMLSGSEAIQNAMLYYAQVRDASSKGITSAHPIYEDLKQRFIAKSKRKTTQS